MLRRGGVQRELESFTTVELAATAWALVKLGEARNVHNARAEYRTRQLWREHVKESGLQVLPAKDLENALQIADKEVPLLITGSLYLAGYTLRFNDTKIN